LNLGSLGPDWVAMFSEMCVIFGIGVNRLCVLCKDKQRKKQNPLGFIWFVVSSGFCQVCLMCFWWLKFMLFLKAMLETERFQLIWSHVFWGEMQAKHRNIWPTKMIVNDHHSMAKGILILQELVKFVWMFISFHFLGVCSKLEGLRCLPLETVQLPIIVPRHLVHHQSTHPWHPWVVRSDVGWLVAVSLTWWWWWWWCW